jgi:hypothetical protein
VPDGQVAVAWLGVVGVSGLFDTSTRATVVSTVPPVEQMA